ncbi:MAG: nucleotide exchange factor GrpE [Chloroflexi bacterium]|nr:MAG: nucleotide exchange factor GrpE [Chloroflexota bacterium]
MMPQDSEEALNSEVEPETIDIEDAEGIKKALAEAEKKTEEYLANWQRAQADFINYKRRNEQERQDFSRFANAELMLSLLPALDDLERALNSVPPAKSAKHSWLEGIRLVERKFKSSLEAQGLTPIKALGEPFDPNFHEAVRQDKGKEGIVIEEFQKGYMLGDRVLRPAKVVVGNGEEEEKEDY